MTNPSGNDRIDALARRYRRIETPHAVTVRILDEAQRRLTPASRWHRPWLATGAVAALALVLIVPIIFVDDGGDTPGRITLRVPGLSSLQGRVPAAPDKALPTLSSLKSLPLVRTRRPAPSESDQTDDSPQSHTPILKDTETYSLIQHGGQRSCEQLINQVDFRRS